MRRNHRLLMLVLVLATASSAFGLEIGTDVIVPAAVRGPGRNQSRWFTDLYVFNPSTLPANIEIFWLTRNQANLNPISETFVLPPGATLVLDDVVLKTFGLNAAPGAFRVVSDRAVAVNSRSYNKKGDVTFGSGLEGVPRSSAVQAGASTDIIGLKHNTNFRTNVILIDATGTGSTVHLSLRDPSGFELASNTYNLLEWEPLLFLVENLGVAEFDDATLHVVVLDGAAIACAGKVDNDTNTGDPTTLQALTPGGTPDGRYDFAIYDSAWFASGGNLVVKDGQVTSVLGTYFNWDKTDGSDSECTLVFPLGGTLSPPVPVGDFSSGVVIEENYPQGGTMTFTMQFDLNSNASFSGTVAAVGSDFPSIDSGCNGTFPNLVLKGGKAPQ
ncbi:MAG: hypothetical protein GY906_34010 [bacterium]|nr:hypothetical protein [bacterium]